MYGCHFQPVYIILWDNPHKVTSYVFRPLLEWEAMGAVETGALCSMRDEGVGGTKGPRTRQPRLEDSGGRVRKEECDTL